MTRALTLISATLVALVVLAGSAFAAIPFGSPLTLTSPFQPAIPGDVLIADINGDGHNDVVATAPAVDHAGSLVVFTSNGAGGFSTGPVVTLGTPQDAHGAADLNGDGRADLLVSPDAKHLLVLFGQADSSFANGPSFSRGTFDWPALADVTGDGVADIVNVRADRVITYVNDGHGAFAAPVTQVFKRNLSSTTSIRGDVTGQSVADFTGDGKADVALALWEVVKRRHHRTSSHAAVVVLPGAGDGHFGRPIVSLLGTGPVNMSRLQAVDVNGDHRPDVAAGGIADDQVESVLVATNKGKGRFNKARCTGLSSCKPFVNESGAYGYVRVAPGDFDADGRADLAAAEFDLTYPRILDGNGRGSFAIQTLKVPPSANSNNHAVAAGDLNGDAKSDLALYNGRNVTVVYGG